LVKLSNEFESVEATATRLTTELIDADTKVTNLKDAFAAAEKAWNTKLQDEKDAARAVIVGAYQQAKFDLETAQADILAAVSNLNDEQKALFSGLENLNFEAIEKALTGDQLNEL